MRDSNPRRRGCKNGGEGNVTDTAEIIDLDRADPGWELIEPMEDKRVNASAVLLPDRNVLAVGGNRTGRFDDPVFNVQVFDSRERRWHRVAPMSVPRGYHSTVILLPDGRVLTGGTTPYGNWELRLEVYSPYYLFRGPRPQIVEVPPRLSYGEPFPVRYESPKDIDRAVLVRPGANTHAFDHDQRHVELALTGRRDGEVIATAPHDAHVAPPGY